MVILANLKLYQLIHQFILVILSFSLVKFYRNDQFITNRQIFKSQHKTVEIQTLSLKMKPKRPDSAKSRLTQKTLDTQLNQSKFSETFTSYSTFQIQKKDDFEKYLEQKQKDPKFKKYFQPSNLAEIPQRAPKPQLQKVNSKPFQKRTSSKITSKPKVQQAPKQSNNKVNLEASTGKWTVNQPNGLKKQNKQQQFNSSKSFAQKNKQKMNSINAGLKKVQNQDKKTQKKIDLKGFKVNIPGKKYNKTNQEQKDAQNQFMTELKQNKSLQSSPQKVHEERPQTKHTSKKVQKTEQQIKREEELLEISRFINDVQMKNIDYYPQGYEQFVQQNQSHAPEDWEKININDFLMEPTERDYKKMQNKIRQNQKTLFDEEKMSQSRVSSISESNPNQTYNVSTDQTSIDLDRMLDGDSEMYDQRQNDDEAYLSSISSKDLKQRNLFLTQILKGRVTKQQIDKLQRMDSSQIKMMKLQDYPKQQEQDFEIVEINMMKKKSNRLFQRNKVEAGGQIYRDCDYLSEQNKLRLERLLNGQLQASPFEQSQWQRFAMRRLDEGIRLYREFSISYSNDLKEQVISEQCLPKDPSLRKQAERKILRDKIDSINSRLKQIQEIVINQTKIQALVDHHRTSKISQSTQSLIDQRNKQIEQIAQKSKIAADMLISAQGQKSQMQRILRQMQAEYQIYEKECKQFQKMTLDEIKQKQMKSLKEKKIQIEELQKSMIELQKGTDQSVAEFHKQMESQIQILRQIQNLNVNTHISLASFHENETTEELNEMFIKRANQFPDTSIHRSLEQEKQNQATY